MWSRCKYKTLKHWLRNVRTCYNCTTQSIFSFFHSPFRFPFFSFFMYFYPNAFTFLCETLAVIPVQSSGLSCSMVFTKLYGFLLHSFLFCTTTASITALLYSTLFLLTMVREMQFFFVDKKGNKSSLANIIIMWMYLLCSTLFVLGKNIVTYILCSLMHIEFMYLRTFRHWCNIMLSCSESVWDFLFLHFCCPFTFPRIFPLSIFSISFPLFLSLQFILIVYYIKLNAT